MGRLGPGTAAKPGRPRQPGPVTTFYRVRYRRGRGWGSIPSGSCPYASAHTAWLRIVRSSNSGAPCGSACCPWDVASQGLDSRPIIIQFSPYETPIYWGAGLWVTKSPLLRPFFSGFAGSAWRRAQENIEASPDQAKRLGGTAVSSRPEKTSNPFALFACTDPRLIAGVCRQSCAGKIRNSPDRQTRRI